MKHYKTVEIPAQPAKTERHLDKVTCDLCQSEIGSRSKLTYEVDEVEIKHRTGYSYPTGGDGDEIKVDMCGNCFDKKLIPWLREQGAEPETTKWDW